jgi:hypothetical protein
VANAAYRGRYDFGPDRGAGARIVLSAPDSSKDLRDSSDVVCGSTAAEVQINAAITKLGGAVGTVFLQDGTYNIDVSDGSGIVVDDNLRLKLSPGATIFLQANAVATFDAIQGASKSNVWIEGGTLNGNRSNMTGTGNQVYGIEFTNCFDMKVTDMNVISMGNADVESGYGIYLNNTPNSLIARCFFSDNSREGVVLFQNSDYGIITDCRSAWDHRPYTIHDS